MRHDRTSSDATCNLLESQVTLHRPIMQPCLKIKIFKHQDVKCDLLQPQEALHRISYYIISKLEFSNTKTLHATCYNLKKRYIGTYATLCSKLTKHIFTINYSKYHHYKSISFKLIRAEPPSGGSALRAR